VGVGPHPPTPQPPIPNPQSPIPNEIFIDFYLKKEILIIKLIINILN
jgi:hypothetical protein